MTASVGRAAPVPTGLRVAAVVLGLEALVAVALAVIELTQIRPDRPGIALGVAILLLGYGVGLAAVTRGLLRIRRWSRGPAVATQLLLLPVAWTFHQGPAWWVTTLLGGAAITALVGLLLPSTTAVLVRPDPTD